MMWLNNFRCFFEVSKCIFPTTNNFCHLLIFCENFSRATSYLKRLRIRSIWPSDATNNFNRAIRRPNSSDAASSPKYLSCSCKKGTSMPPVWSVRQMWEKYLFCSRKKGTLAICGWDLKFSSRPGKVKPYRVVNPYWYSMRGWVLAPIHALIHSIMYRGPELSIRAAILILWELVAPLSSGATSSQNLSIVARNKCFDSQYMSFGWVPLVTKAPTPKTCIAARNVRSEPRYLSFESLWLR